MMYERGATTLEITGRPASTCIPYITAPRSAAVSASGGRTIEPNTHFVHLS